VVANSRRISANVGVPNPTPVKVNHFLADGPLAKLARLLDPVFTTAPEFHQLLLGQAVRSANQIFEFLPIKSSGPCVNQVDGLKLDILDDLA
jgi:hypothetical protein